MNSIATTDKEIRAAIIHRMDTNPRAVEWALKAVFANQTSDEQAAEETRHLNGKGFTAADAAFLSSLVKKLEQYGGLTDRQVLFARKCLIKHWRQVAEALKARNHPIQKAPDGYVSPYAHMTSRAQIFEYERSLQKAA